MDTPWVKRALTFAVGLVVAMIALLLLWPRTAAGPDPAAARSARAAPVAATAGTAQAPAPAAVAGAPTTEDEELEHATPQCTTIVKWHRRNVPGWVIEDNMMAQGMKFDEADLACLTAAGVTPQILDFAEQNTKRPQPPVPK